jgi:hypothetical protein
MSQELAQKGRLPSIRNVKTIIVRLDAGTTIASLAKALPHPIEVVKFTASTHGVNEEAIVGFVTDDAVFEGADITVDTFNDFAETFEAVIGIGGSNVIEKNIKNEGQRITASSQIVLHYIATAANFHIMVNLDYIDRFDLATLDDVKSMGEIQQVGVQTSAGNEFHQVGDKVKGSGA